jgi:hypothetical protein
VREVNQERELCRQHGHGPVTLNVDYMQAPIVDVKDVSGNKVMGWDSHRSSPDDEVAAVCPGGVRGAVAVVSV